MVPRNRFPACMQIGLALALGGILAGCRARTPPPPRPSPPPGPLAGVTVVLDPGHGGADSGVIRGGLREDMVTYRMAATLAAALRRRGAAVAFTVRSRELEHALEEGKPEPRLRRPDDARLAFNDTPVRPRASAADLYRRAAAARAVWDARPKATRRSLYFLALHADGLGNPRWRGARVYFDTRGRRTPPALATALKRRLTAAGLTNSPGGFPLPRRYGVLHPAYNPIPQRVLVEFATISNASDRTRMQTARGRWQVARVLAEGILDCQRAPR